VTATDETRFRRPPRVHWGVVCGDGEVVWARDEAAARRLLASLVGAIRIVCEEAPAEAVEQGCPAPVGPSSGPFPASACTARPYPR
jgi:hypothetical protein